MEDGPMRPLPPPPLPMPIPPPPPPQDLMRRPPPRALGGRLPPQPPRLREVNPFSVNDMGEDLRVCPCNKCQMKRPHPVKGFPWAEYDVIDPTEVESLELPELGDRDKMHRYILCSHQLWGFVLKSREWRRANQPTFTLVAKQLTYGA